MLVFASKSNARKFKRGKANFLRRLSRYPKVKHFGLHHIIGNITEPLMSRSIAQEIVQSISDAVVEELIAPPSTIAQDSFSDALHSALQAVAVDSAVSIGKTVCQPLLAAAIASKDDHPQPREISSTASNDVIDFTNSESSRSFRALIVEELELESPTEGKAAEAVFIVPFDHPSFEVPDSNVERNITSGCCYSQLAQLSTSPGNPVKLALSLIRHVLLPVVTHSLAHTAPTSAIHHISAAVHQVLTK